jgi:hypothetical protein
MLNNFRDFFFVASLFANKFTSIYLLCAVSFVFSDERVEKSPLHEEACDFKRGIYQHSIKQSFSLKQFPTHLLRLIASLIISTYFVSHSFIPIWELKHMLTVKEENQLLCYSLSTRLGGFSSLHTSHTRLHGFTFAWFDICCSAFIYSLTLTH